MRILAAVYGLVCYGIFLAAFLYAVGFVGNLVVPRSIDHAIAAPLGEALAWDILLLGVFAVQHSVMARPAFKRLWTRVTPVAVERSTYVLFSSLALILLYWQWREIPAPVWTATAPAAVLALQALFWAGWGLVLVSTFLISHFELFGLRQVWLTLRRRPFPDPAFSTPFLYAFVRHPIYLGFILAFWATPAMTVGHLLFAAATTAYILIAIQLEERDLIATFGDTYVGYRRRVSMLIPMPPRAP
ncbi:MAG: methanethiol S-methyltransferase [Pseudomonadota bacterium]